MNWLQIALAQSNDYTAFYFINGEFHFFNGLHVYWLTKAYNISYALAWALASAWPRGRVGGDSWKPIIEMSPELEPYKSQIAGQLDVRAPIEWRRSDDHYAVSPTQEVASRIDQKINAGSLTNEELALAKQLLPELSLSISIEQAA